MPSNIEIKARLDDASSTRARIEALVADAPERLVQEDVFFTVPSGRLKLRSFTKDRGELILYHRTDESGPSRSNYQIAPTTRPATLRDILASVLGEAGVVKKVRAVYLHGQTRIHLDEVESLGAFLELEVVLRPEQSDQDGFAIARDLMQRLDIREEQLVSEAYVDLLRRAAYNSQH